MQSSQKTGVFYALAAYGFWGFAPIYFKWVGHVGAFEVVANRVLWSVILLFIIITLLKQWAKIV